MIKSKETEYKDTVFRSRLEARWAVFLDALDIEWLYEPKKFRFKDGTIYIPDFYLPQVEYWLEIKPDFFWLSPGLGMIIHKARSLALHTNQKVLIIAGLPFMIFGEIGKGRIVGYSPEDKYVGVTFTQLSRLLPFGDLVKVIAAAKEAAEAFKDDDGPDIISVPYPPLTDEQRQEIEDDLIIARAKADKEYGLPDYYCNPKEEAAILAALARKRGRKKKEGN